jgi:hypothetical protein
VGVTAGDTNTARPVKGKRLRLTPAGELRALWRLRSETDLEIRRLRGVVMAKLENVEVLDAYVKVGDADLPIYVSEATNQAIYQDAWAGLEKNLVDANAEYNATGKEPLERALGLLSALGEARRFADVIVSLTPLPDEEI